MTPSHFNLPRKALLGIGLLIMAVGLGSFSNLSSAKNKNPPAFKPAPLEPVVAPQVPTLPVAAPPASAPPFSVPSPTLKPIQSASADPPESHVVSDHNFEAQVVLKAGKPVEIGAPPGSFLERHSSEQRFPLIATALRIGEGCSRPTIRWGYGQPFQDESAFRVCTSHPRREEPSCAYFKITLSF
jgi:hypothetical protein